MTVNVTVMYFDGCPGWQTALERVKAAAVLARVRVRVDLVDVSSDEDAARLGFTGSPTIVVDGTDPFATPGSRPALACRLYATAQGPACSPSLEQLVEVLSRAGRRTSALHARAPWSTRLPQRAQRWVPDRFVAQ